MNNDNAREDNKMDRQENIWQIRKNWFNGHTVSIINENGNTVILWKNPNTNDMIVRYMVDGCNITASGDMGIVTFELSDIERGFLSCPECPEHWIVIYFVGLQMCWELLKEVLTQ